LSAALTLLGQEMDSVGVKLRECDEPLLEPDKEDAIETLREFDEAVSAVSDMMEPDVIVIDIAADEPVGVANPLGDNE
jgi:hypothetical protein